MRSLQESLERLKLDRVDMLLLHDPDYYFKQAMAGAYKALERLRADGTVGAIGVGMNQSAMLTRFAREADFDCFLVAGRYTFLDQTALDDLLPSASSEEQRHRRRRLQQRHPGRSPAGHDFNYEPAAQAVARQGTEIKAVCDRHGVPLKRRRSSSRSATRLSPRSSPARAPSPKWRKTRRCSSTDPGGPWADFVRRADRPARPDARAATLPRWRRGGARRPVSPPPDRPADQRGGSSHRALHRAAIPGAFIVDLEPHADDRGSSPGRSAPRVRRTRTDNQVAQVNTSFNDRRGTLRGLHYQAEPAAKRSSSLHRQAPSRRPRRHAARVADVSAPRRSVELSADNRRAVYLPKLVAAGVQTLADDSELFYQLSEFYTPEAERGLRFDDPVFGIDWPLPVAEISDKDAAWPYLAPGGPA